MKFFITTFKLNELVKNPKKTSKTLKKWANKANKNDHIFN